jgi:hypothetical protein
MEASPTDLPRGRTRTTRKRSSRTRKKARSARRTRHANTKCPSPRQRADGLHRRADSCNPASDYIATSHATEVARVGECRLERANPTMDPGGGTDTVLKNSQPPRFSQVISLLDVKPAQLDFANRELARFVQAGVREPSTCSDYVSKLFLVPKQGNNKWRLICDLRPFNM